MLKDIRPISSKEQELEPSDIFVVAAHQYVGDRDAINKAAKKEGMSPERLVYTLLVQDYSDPRLLRIRSGNTLFAIAILPDEVGYVKIYNGDTPKEFVGNVVELVTSARTMGFKKLVTKLDEVNFTVLRAVYIKLKALGCTVLLDRKTRWVRININD